MYLIFCRFTLLKYNTSYLCYFEQERKLILATVHILTYDTLEVCLYWPIRWEHTPVISCAEIVDPHLTLFSLWPTTHISSTNTRFFCGISHFNLQPALFNIFQSSGDQRWSLCYRKYTGNQWYLYYNQPLLLQIPLSEISHTASSIFSQERWA